MTDEDVLSKTEVSSDKLESGALELRSLSIGYDEPLISGINLKINPGETVAILGPSGIGKTTLLRTIAGLIVPLSGEVIHDFPKRSGIGYIPQRLGLVKHSSVRVTSLSVQELENPGGFQQFFHLEAISNSDVNSALISLGHRIALRLPCEDFIGWAAEKSCYSESACSETEINPRR
ncbi:MAG: hypothetical protein CM15mP71_5080 [Candidatus Poseidoniales archaeon]|nr:MAG: hypothetical protein CM15mP71_5080 [Candidatus Poseidoniales archaeon]